MFSRAVTVFLSGCNVAGAFVPVARGGIRIDDSKFRIREAAGTRPTPPSRQIHAGARHCRCSRSESSISSSKGHHAGQDPGEMFDVYLPPESLSVISGQPKPAGLRKARSLVHADGDWHRSVHIWLHNGRGELVLQKRSAAKDTFPGMWDVSVGGHFTAGESSIETAIKETSEELGLDCDERKLRFVCTVATSSTGSTAKHGDFVCNEYKDIYLMRYDGPLSELHFSPDEVDDVKLVPMDELASIYADEDPGYIPRPAYYTTPMFDALRGSLQ